MMARRDVYLVIADLVRDGLPEPDKQYLVDGETAIATLQFGYPSTGRPDAGDAIREWANAFGVDPDQVKVEEFAEADTRRYQAKGRHFRWHVVLWAYERIAVPTVDPAAAADAVSP